METPDLLLERIVSGGQTGADRAALDFAIEHRIPHGGWCPLGRLAEDGTIDPRYQLKETPGRNHAQRTEWNVRDSDGTVVFSIAPELTGGSSKTVLLANKLGKSVLHISEAAGVPFPEQELEQFIEDNHIKVLNVAGPRASEEPEVAAFVTEVLGSYYAQSSLSQPPRREDWRSETDQLILRSFTLSDAPAVARLAGERRIADTTFSIPHPYTEHMAVEWIVRNKEGGNNEFYMAVCSKTDQQLAGAAGLRNIEYENLQAEMEFWIGLDWWGRGYAPEAAKFLLQTGFESLHLNRIYAHHLLRDPASGRVLKKIGMEQEGILRQRLRKWGIFEDVALLSIIRKDSLAM